MFLRYNSLEEISQKLFFILSNQPLIQWYVKAFVSFVFYDFLFENCWTVQSLYVPAEMVETMNFNNQMFNIFKLRNVDIANDIIEIVFH